MMENAREWAREKTDLKQRLLERTGVFHDPDILDPSYILVCYINITFKYNTNNIMLVLLLY